MNRQAVDDAKHMAQAIRLAEKGQYTTHPNPRVGAVIVNGEQIVGQGFHLKAGEGHAEAHALKQAGNGARGGSVYCTLEPCSFHGRTPSCAQALIDAGVSRVVVAMVDPDARNAGRGLDMLRAAGIVVECGLMESSARSLNPGHIKRIESGLPFVRLKLAMSLDGKTALANGVSQWITGRAARQDVQRWRARSAAIVTGVQTINDDDPLLNVRADDLAGSTAAMSATIRRPVVVLDPTQRVRRDARVLDNPDTILVSLAGNAPARDITCEQMTGTPDGAGRIDLRALLVELAAREFSEVLFECGATLAGSLVQHGLVDEFIVYAAPTFLGSDARSLLQLAKIDSMHDRRDLTVIDIRSVGSDIRFICRPK